MLFGLLALAFTWWFRSRAAGAWAVIGLVALPLALATGSETRLGFTLPLSVTVSEVSVWVALALMVVAVTLVEQATRVAARRGNVTDATVTWIVFVASSALGMALVISARVQGESWCCRSASPRSHPSCSGCPATSRYEPGCG